MKVLEELKINYMKKDEIKIAIIGLGYVGLPLAVEFSRKYQVVGFDTSLERISDLINGIDKTEEISQKELLKALSNQKNGLKLSSKADTLKMCNVFIVTVPTPIDKYNKPDLTPLIRASETVALCLKKNDIVIYESTVYPGATEEVCMPVLQKNSNLIFNKDFFIGYSPERINPGDKTHTLTNIMKITSGSNKSTSLFVDNLYKSIIKAGTFNTSSIKVAEAAKVIENTQRDINIAFVNELSIIFNLLKIDTTEVLEAAGTKWNFIKFKPGLVGGHCIGVDPYYLAQKSQEVGYHPEIILAGRRTNDSMGKYIASESVKLMLRKGLKISASKALILGITFKENCPDYRNTKVIDVFNELKTYDMKVDIFDPHVENNKVFKEYGIKLLEKLDSKDLNNYSLIVLAVAHNEFKNFLIKPNKFRVIYDVKSYLNKINVDGRL